MNEKVLSQVSRVDPSENSPSVTLFYPSCRGNTKTICGVQVWAPTPTVYYYFLSLICCAIYNVVTYFTFDTLVSSTQILGVPFNLTYPDKTETFQFYMQLFSSGCSW